MYKNTPKIASSLTVNTLCGLPWFGLSILMILYDFLAVTGQVSLEKRDPGMAIILTCLSFFCAYVFGKRLRRLKFAGKLGTYFEQYEDGLVPIEAAAEYMGRKQHKFFVLFLDCVGITYLQNCGIFADDPTFILLENGGKRLEDKFAIVHCTQCAAPNAIRLGFENSCKYCGSVIKWKG